MKFFKDMRTSLRGSVIDASATSEEEKTAINLKSADDITEQNDALSIASEEDEANPPLYEAASKGNIDEIERLLQHHRQSQIISALTTTNDKGGTPLHVAASKGNSAVIALLLGKIENESDKHRVVMATNNNGVTPVHAAARGGDVASLEALLASMPEEMRVEAVNTKTDKDMNPLHLAAFKGHLAMTTHLLEVYGMDPTIRCDTNKGFTATMRDILKPGSAKGETAWERAKDGHEQFKEWRREEMKKPKSTAATNPVYVAKDVEYGKVSMLLYQRELAVYVDEMRLPPSSQVGKARWIPPAMQRDISLALCQG